MRKKAAGFFISIHFQLVLALVAVVVGLGMQTAHRPAVAADPGDLLARPEIVAILPERALPPPPPPSAPPPAPEPPELVGTVGYALAWGNCVQEPGINNPGYGNPIGWPVTSLTPTIGATAVFTWNHVGVVTGIWRNGDIEVRHQNYWGGGHRFPPSLIRGYR